MGFTPLSLSGLLNAMDGVSSSDGRLLFMTTNYAERLDAALIRPGRVDYKCYVGHATEYQAYRMFQNFYPELASDEMAREFAGQLGALKRDVSAAQIQGHFLFYKNEPSLAIRNLHTIGK